MGHSCAHVMGGVSSLVTIGLAVDFVGTAQVGQWLAVETDVVKTGSTICFAQSLIKADDVVIARANATFRVVPKKEPVAPNTRACRVSRNASRLVSVTRSMKVRTLADSSRDVG